MRAGLISVIVPVYNIGQYIPECLDSITSQTYRDLEIICVDDGSTDGSGEILDAYERSDPRIRVIHKANGGVTDARLCGITEAEGEWIGFVDGDDSIEPEMYERLIANAEKYCAEISHCGYQMVFPDRVDFYYGTGTLREQSGREAVKDLLFGVLEPGLWNKLFRRELIDSVLAGVNVNRSIKINEDLLMNFYLFRQAEHTVFEDICPYHYRIRLGSAAIAAADAKKLEDILRVRRILLSETTEDAELHGLCLQNYTGQLIRTASMRTAGCTPEIREVILQARQELKGISANDMKNAGFSAKLIGQVVLTSALPGLYRLVHHIYGEITGINHKYDLRPS